jgi:ABC-type multidrug transport system ATPase subunit
VRQQREDGVTVVISSHILGELEEMSDIVAFVDAGRSRGVYPLAALPRSQATMQWRIRALGGLEEALTRSQVSWEALAPGRALIDAASDEAAADLLAQLVSQGVRVVEMTPVGGGLEGAFLAMDEGAST